MASSNDLTVPILVLGAGPAGLALGAELLKRGAPFLIVEQGLEVGHSWQRMPSRLKLVSPWKANWLRPGDASRFPAHHETTRDEFADYLRDFAAERHLPVRTNVEVKTVRRDADEGFIVETSDGERSTTLWPENLLAWATERRIHLRGEQENLYFVDKRKLKAGQRFGPAPIPSPWRRLARKLGF